MLYRWRFSVELRRRSGSNGSSGSSGSSGSNGSNGSPALRALSSWKGRIKVALLFHVSCRSPTISLTQLIIETVILSLLVPAAILSREGIILHHYDPRGCYQAVATPLIDSPLSFIHHSPLIEY